MRKRSHVARPRGLTVNLGNAIGAALGGGVIDLGLGYPAVAVAGALAAASGLTMIAVVMISRRDPERMLTM